MGATISHALSATTPDNTSYEIRPSHWNSGHLVTMNAVGSEISGAFSNSNGVSFGLEPGGALTASYTQFQFSNSNGVSFGTNGGTVTAAVKTDYLTTAMASNRGSDFVQATAAFAGTNASGTIASNGISVSVAAPGAANIKISAGTLSAVRSDVTFADSNGVSFGLNTNGVLTGTVKTDYQSSNANYLTSQSNQAVSGQNGSFTFQTASFSNANGISFGTSAGPAITASHNGLTTARASNDAIGLNTDQTNVTWTVNSSGLSLNAAGYAGTGTTFAGANVSGSITQNSNGLNLSLSVAAGGAAANLQYFEAADEVAFGLMTNITAINSRPIFVPFWLPGNLTNNGLIIQMSRSTSASNAFTVQAGIYTYVNSTSVARLASLQNAFSASDTGSVSGIRYFIMSGWENAGTSLTPGAYVLGMNFSAGATASMNYSLFGGLTASQPVGFVRQGSNQNNTNNTTWGVMNMWGRYTANSAGMPANVVQADITANFSGASIPLAPWFVMGQVT